MFKEVKAILKRIAAKRVNFSQATGIDADLCDTVTIFLQGIEQLARRRAVEIALQFQVQMVAVSVNGYSEIGCHDDTSFHM